MERDQIEDLSIIGEDSSSDSIASNDASSDDSQEEMKVVVTDWGAVVRAELNNTTPDITNHNEQFWLSRVTSCLTDNAKMIANVTNKGNESSVTNSLRFERVDGKPVDGDASISSVSTGDAQIDNYFYRGSGSPGETPRLIKRYSLGAPLGPTLGEAVDGEEAIAIGDSMAEKPTGTIRIPCFNTGGIRNNNTAIESMIQHAQDLEVDIQCFGEINLDTRKTHIKKALAEGTRVIDKTAKCIWGSSLLPAPNDYKPGGTAIVTMGKSTGRVRAQGSDNLAHQKTVKFYDDNHSSHSTYATELSSSHSSDRSSASSSSAHRKTVKFYDDNHSSRSTHATELSSSHGSHRSSASSSSRHRKTVKFYDDNHSSHSIHATELSSSHGSDPSSAWSPATSCGNDNGNDESSIAIKLIQEIEIDEYEANTSDPVKEQESKRTTRERNKNIANTSDPVKEQESKRTTRERNKRRSFFFRKSSKSSSSLLDLNHPTLSTNIVLQSCEEPIADHRGRVIPSKTNQPSSQWKDGCEAVIVDSVSQTESTAPSPLVKLLKERAKRDAVFK